MNKILSIGALLVASSVYGAGSCIICPYGYTCAGGTNAPVKAEVPAAAPVGSVIYMANNNAVNYSGDFYDELSSDEKNALDALNLSTSEDECPSGYLYADGRTLNIKDYPALFTRIGQTYGYNPAKQYTTFKLPDLRDAFLRGTGGENAAAVGTKQEDAIKTHDTTSTSKELTGDFAQSDTTAGTFSDSSGVFSLSGTENGRHTSGTYFGGNKQVSMDVTHEHTYEGEEETRPVNYAMYACIKY